MLALLAALRAKVINIFDGMTQGRPSRNRANPGLISKTPCGVLNMRRSLTLYPRTAALHHMHYFIQRDLGSIAARGLQERAVGRAKVHDFLRLHAVEKTIRDAARKSIATADAVFDLQIFELSGLVEFPGVTQRIPPQ